MDVTSPRQEGHTPQEGIQQEAASQQEVPQQEIISQETQGPQKRELDILLERDLQDIEARSPKGESTIERMKHTLHIEPQ